MRQELRRLDHDGLVQPSPVPAEAGPVFELSPEGRREAMESLAAMAAFTSRVERFLGQHSRSA